MDASVGIVGGTGALGRGLAARFVRAGLHVALGSRDPARAEAAAAEVASLAADSPGSVRGVGNLDAAGSAAVVLAVPYETLDEVLTDLRPAMEGRLVVSAVNPLAFGPQGPHALPVAEGSAAQRIAAAWPNARVTGAFHTLSSRELAQVERPMDDDVPVVGDDEDAIAEVVALADRIEGCRGVAVGPLHLASVLEVLTPMLISINRRAKTHAGIRFSRR